MKGSRLKTSASDSKLVRSRGRAKLEVTDDLGVHCEEEEPEFYRSDLLSVLKEKTNYMTLYFDAEDEISLLREQFRRCDHPLIHRCLPVQDVTHCLGMVISDIRICHVSLKTILMDFYCS